jgi:DNA topoisomerase I
MKLVVVESPAKAKTINKYLGSEYAVEASFGHVCDLPSKNGSVLPDNDFEMKYEVSPRSVSHIKKLSDLAKKSDEVILATDPDREGEAISWHVVNILKDNKSLKHNPKISRVAFNEITKKAVQEAISNPRELDQHLIDAQQARRALDYLVGFNLSPVLWRKLPGAKSAGRVQSVALKLICEREDEIERFITREYWDIFAQMQKQNLTNFSSKLIIANSEKLEKFSIETQEQAHKLKQQLEVYTNFIVTSIEKKVQKRNPAAPFTTSTLQQEASRKLGFSAKKTMQIAQKLYEGVDIGSQTIGLITYMRTDGVYMAADAIKAARDYISGNFGDKYLPKATRQYKTKSKNAQEAHEAIRPTDFSLAPNSVSKGLDKDQLKLYELIWKRALASQMESAEFDVMTVDISSPDNKFIFRANGSAIKFDGFYKLYIEGKDDSEGEDEDNDKLLPPLEKGEVLHAKSIDPKQHFTEPPPRYNEASLVKKLEELGIGRPSTYATIISVIIERQYVKLDKKRFIPEERGRLVTAFLKEFFTKYVEYDFTANLEEELDKVAEGKMKWKDLLKQFWDGFSEKVSEMGGITITNVIESLEQIMENHLFPKSKDSDADPRKCPSCTDGRLGLRLGKFGAFIACGNYPECNYKKSIESGEGGSSDEENSDSAPKQNENKLLGEVNGKEVYLKKGPYGYYVELPDEILNGKPKRVSVPTFVNLQDLTLKKAEELLSLPIKLGMNPESQEIFIGIGKFGPYIKCGNKFTSVPKSEDPFSLNLSRALEIIDEAVKMKEKKK